MGKSVREHGSNNLEIIIIANFYFVLLAMFFYFIHFIAHFDKFELIKYKSYMRRLAFHIFTKWKLLS